jgi:beta-lactamase class A
MSNLRRAVSSFTARLALPLLLILPGCATAQAKPDTSNAPSDTAALRATLGRIVGAHHGVVGYSIRDLDTGEELSLRGDETFPTASLIKVPILVTLYDLVEQGKISLDDPLTILAIDKVPGSGVMQFLHDGAIVTVHDAVWLMSTESDNTATNLLLDRIIIRRVWEKMESLGRHHTKVHTKTIQRV